MKSRRNPRPTACAIVPPARKAEYFPALPPRARPALPAFAARYPPTAAPDQSGKAFRVTHFPRHSAGQSPPEPSPESPPTRAPAEFQPDLPITQVRAHQRAPPAPWPNDVGSLDPSVAPILPMPQSPNYFRGVTQELPRALRAFPRRAPQAAAKIPEFPAKD